MRKTGDLDAARKSVPRRVDPAALMMEKPMVEMAFSTLARRVVPGATT